MACVLYHMENILDFLLISYTVNIELFITCHSRGRDHTSPANTLAATWVLFVRARAVRLIM